jgi:hypothetical protein
MGLSFCNCCWPSPAQSFSDPSPAELTTIFYCLRFEALPIWRARFPYLYPQGTGWPRYPQALGCLSSPTIRSATVDVVAPQHGPHRKHSSSILMSRFVAVEMCLPPQTIEKRPFLCCWSIVAFVSLTAGNFFTEPLPENGSCILAYLAVTA